jgi:hypothetical protein
LGTGRRIGYGQRRGRQVWHIFAVYATGWVDGKNS